MKKRSPRVFLFLVVAWLSLYPSTVRCTDATIHDPAALRQFLVTRVDPTLLQARPLSGLVAFTWCVKQRIEAAIVDYVTVQGHPSIEDFAAVKAMLDTRPFAIYARYEYDVHRMHRLLLRRDIGFAVAVELPATIPLSGGAKTLLQGFVTSVLHGVILHVLSKPFFVPVKQVYHEVYFALHSFSLRQRQLTDGELGGDWRQTCLARAIMSDIPARETTPPPPIVITAIPVAPSPAVNMSNTTVSDAVVPVVSASCVLVFSQHERCPHREAISILDCSSSRKQRICRRFTDGSLDCTCR